MIISSGEKRKKRHIRTRKRINGTAERPRLVVYRSNLHITAAFVNDDETPCRVMTAVSSAGPEFKKTAKDGAKGCNIKGALVVGQLASLKGKDAGIQTVVFDRAGYQFTGRVKALADAARKGGLKF